MGEITLSSPITTVVEMYLVSDRLPTRLHKTLHVDGSEVGDSVILDSSQGHLSVEFLHRLLHVFKEACKMNLKCPKCSKQH